MSYAKMPDYRPEEMVWVEATDKFLKGDKSFNGKVFQEAKSQAKLLVDAGKAKYAKEPKQSQSF